MLPNLPEDDHEIWNEAEKHSIRIEENECKHEFRISFGRREVTCKHCGVSLYFDYSNVNESERKIYIEDFEIKY